MRSRNSGTIHQLAPGRWFIKYSDGTGRRRGFRVTGTRVEAERRLTLARAAVLNGTHSADRRITVADVHRRWLDAAATRVRPLTRQWLDGVARHLLDDPLARRPVDQVKPSELESALRRLQLAGVSDRVRRELRRQLGGAFDLAMRDDLVSRNPARLSAPVAGTKPRSRALTAVELQVFLGAVAGSRHEALAWVLAGAGCRVSEALGLGWGDIDFEAGRVHIRRGLHRISGAWRIEQPKTRAGTRTVPIPPAVVSRLRAWRAVQAQERLVAGPLWRDEIPGVDLVFRAPSGGPLHVSVVATAINAAYRRAGVDASGLHVLRHSQASLLLSAGADLATVSATLGHSSPQITLSVYTHAVSNARVEVADRMSAILGA